MSTEIGATAHKFVVILNKRLEVGVALNAAAHMAAGLVGKATSGAVEQMKFIDFIDKDNMVHPSVSALSLIVLRGTSNEIAKVCGEARERRILYVDFVNTMTGDTYVEQLERTKATSTAELEYYGVALFAEKTELNELTRKFSLWR